MAKYKKITTSDGSEIAVAISEKALKDNEGNSIIDTYAKKEELPTIDTELSTSSTNPVQNKVLGAKLNEVDSRLSGHDYHQIDTTIAQWNKGVLNLSGRPQDVTIINTYDHIKLYLLYNGNEEIYYLDRKDIYGGGVITFTTGKTDLGSNGEIVSYEIFTYKPNETTLTLGKYTLVTNETNFTDYN